MPRLNAETISMFPACCGIDILSQLSLSNTGTVPSSLRTVQLMATAGGQTDILAPYLKRRKYKPIFRFRNSNSGNTVTLWARGPVTLVRNE